MTTRVSKKTAPRVSAAKRRPVQVGDLLSVPMVFRGFRTGGQAVLSPPNRPGHWFVVSPDEFRAYRRLRKKKNIRG